MNNRIKQLRDQLSMNQEAFGSRLGISGAAISLLESGKRNITEKVVISICREFNVSRAWLEDGIEPMFAEAAEDDIQVVLRAMEGQSEAKKKLMRILADMPDELLDKMIEYLESTVN